MANTTHVGEETPTPLRNKRDSDRALKAGWIWLPRTSSGLDWVASGIFSPSLGYSDDSTTRAPEVVIAKTPFGQKARHQFTYVHVMVSM